MLVENKVEVWTGVIHPDCTCTWAEDPMGGYKRLQRETDCEIHGDLLEKLMGGDRDQN